MLGKNFSFRGVSLPWTTQEGINAGYYTDIRWKDIETSTQVRNKEGYHGAYVSPTLASGRLITISGEIFNADKELRGDIRSILDNIFVLEAVPSQTNGIYTLAFTDDNEEDWNISCQVYSMPRYEHERGSVVIKFSVDLFAPSPFLLSATEITESGIYGRPYGVTLPTLLPASLSSGLNAIEAVNTGNFASRPVITISGDIVNPVVYNLTTGRFWRQNRTLSGTDELVINTLTNTVKYNGVDDSGNRGDGSNFIFINHGTNILLLTGEDFDIDNQSKATFSVVYRKTML